MLFSSSQEKTIFNQLAGQIQLGFYDNGERFPSAQEIARQFQVSYCPAQRALKALEEAGLISLCRGKETIVLKKPYQDFLQTPDFMERVSAIADLSQSLVLISPGIELVGVCNMGADTLGKLLPVANGDDVPWKSLYALFRAVLVALGSNTVLSLYYDISCFIGSSYMDIFNLRYLGTENGSCVSLFLKDYMECIASCRNGEYEGIYSKIENINSYFFNTIDKSLKDILSSQPIPEQIAYQWAPHKGRKQYCDPIAIELLCQIYQGIYPKGTFLPKNSMFAEKYGVSEITIRRTLAILNKAGITETINGVGTRVVFQEKKEIATLLKAVMLEDNLLIFLETLQLLSMTCERVINYTFPYLSDDALSAISGVMYAGPVNVSAVEAVNTCMQEIARCCPLAAIREIYKKLSLLLLNGNALRLYQPVKNAEAGWSVISKEIAEAITAKDGKQFASAFHRLTVNIFYDMREYLIAAGINGVERIAAPV